MRRREFLGVMGGVATWSLAARAQQAMPVVGLFHVGSSDKFGHLVAAFRRGLAEADLVEGRNVAIEYGWAEGQLDRLPALAADLMRRQVSVIAGNYIATAAVKRVAPTLPIVFVTGDDPVKLGFVESLNRPGGNTTGVYIFTAELEAKRLGLLRDLVPQATTFALLVDPNYSTTDAQVRDVQKASARLGVQLVVARANSERDIEAAFATFVQQRAAALLVGASPFFNNRRDQLVSLAARHKLPATYESREFAAAGGLVSYGNSITDAYRQAGVYAGLIVKGAKPADLPVIQPSKFELVINLTAAKALGVAISGNLLTLADEVIE
jgi:ABC-type uncharacterized transport system substrate-binding protein